MELNPLNWSPFSVAIGCVWKFSAAGLAGLGVGTMLSPEPMAIPLLGTVPRLVVGASSLVVGGVLYQQAPKSAGCGCGSDCSS